MGALVEHGIAKQYLDEHCATKSFKLCTWKDSLPDRANDFVWHPQSPLAKAGGWKETKEEYNLIIGDIFTSPKYIGLFTVASVKATGLQLVRFAAGDGNGPFLKGSPVHDRITQYLPADEARFAHSSINQLGLSTYLHYSNWFSLLVILLSLTWLLFRSSKWVKANQPHLRMALLLILVGIVLNTWDCGTFANAIDRLGAKMM